MYAFDPSALCCAPKTSAKIFVGMSLLSDAVKVSVALTAKEIPVEPVNVIVFPVTIV